MQYDEGGKIARSGNINTTLLEQLNGLVFYQKQAPKSLGREWVESEVLPILNQFNISTENKLRTFTEHVAIQISNHLPSYESTLITGGGAYNSFLIERINKLQPTSQTLVPKAEIVEFKEAIIFAFLGLKRLLGEVNTLPSVTGASSEVSGGDLYLP
jgi:anhydro-N-acetylmuramic acid kinase